MRNFKEGPGHHHEVCVTLAKWKLHLHFNDLESWQRSRAIFL